MKALKRIERHLEEYVMGVLLVCIALIMLLQVVMRIMKMSLPWPEELARYMYVWSVFLSVSYSIRNGSILKVDLLLQMLPKLVKKVVSIAMELVGAAFYGMLGYYSIFVMLDVKASNQTSTAMELPMYIIYVIIPIGFFLASIRSVQQIYGHVTGAAEKAVPAKD